MKKTILFVIILIVLGCKQEKTEYVKKTPEEVYKLKLFVLKEFNEKRYKEVYLSELKEILKDSMSQDLRNRITFSIDSLNKMIESMPDDKLSDYVTTESIDNQFSSYDGSHIKLEEYVKNNMQNPDSYQHVSSKYKVFDDYLHVVLTFRGSNAYGGIVTQNISAKCSLIDGNVIEIIN